MLDGHGKIVMPGFVDVHNHLWQTLIRGCATDQELNGWLRGCVLPLYSSGVSGADGYAGARLGTLDVISSGVTTVTDWSRAVSHDFARFPTPPDVLRMATLGGAEVLGLDGEIGSLTPGKQADVQVINPAALDFAPELDWISQLVFNGQPANVEWVFVAGRALKRDGRVIGDTARVIADAQAASERIQKLLGRNSHPGGR